MKGIIMSRYFAVGDFVEICEDINCIPKGIYEYLGMGDQLHFFTIGDKIQFAVTDHKDVRFKRVPRTLGLNVCTGANDFLDRYYELMENLPDTGRFDFSKPFTICGIHPNLARDTFIN